MTVREFMAGIDACIFRAPIVESHLTFGTFDIIGAFFKDARTIAMPGGDISGIGISFECRYSVHVAELAKGDHVQIDGTETYRFLRELCPGGDESGLTTLELAEVIE